VRCYGFLNDGTSDLGTSSIVSSWFTSNSQVDADSSEITVSMGNFISADGVSYNKVIASAPFGNNIALLANNCLFKKIQVNSDQAGYYCVINGSGNNITELVGYAYIGINGSNIVARADFYNGVQVEGDNTIGRANFMDNVYLSGNNVFDSVYFNNPGITIILDTGYIQTVNADIQVNSNGGFPVTIQSSTPGTQATLSKASDTVCLNFIYLQDIVGTGGAVFYAGDNSFDLGNNTGWQFTSCVQAFSNVWPGDANYDLVANNMDILNIGLAYNETGFVRPGATINWVAETCLDWFSQFNNGTNTKHADCDGNGIVNANDTTAVSQNYSLVHPAMAPYNPLHRTTLDLYLDFSSATIHQGDVISVPVKLGTSGSPASNIYGIAFSVNYNQDLIQNGDININYDGSWLVSSSNNVHLEKNFSSSGRLDVGFSRTDHINQSGNGTIAVINFKASTTNTGTLIFTLDNIKANDNNGIEIPIVSAPDSVSVLTSINTLQKETQLAIFPNPVSDYAYVYFSGFEIKDYDIDLYTLEGRLIKTIPGKTAQQSNGAVKIEVSDIPSGVYLLTFRTNAERITKHLIVIKEE
jgi:hypothetical protein